MSRKLIPVLLLSLITILGSSPVQAAETLTIPFITIKTGAIAHIGLEVEWAVNAAVKEINAGGGIAGKQVALKTFDTGYDPARAVSCMKEAVQNSLVIIGPLSTMDVRSCAAIAARNEVMTLPVASSIAEVSKVYPWAVVFIPSIELISHSVVDWLAIYPDIKSVVIFRDTKNPVWIEQANLFDKFSKEKGIKVLDMIDVAADAVDVSSPVVRALGKNPDGVLFGTESAQTARLIMEMKKRGWNKMDHLACHTAVVTPSFFQVGGEGLDGVYILGVTMDYEYPAPRWQNFIKAFGDTHGGAKPPMYVPPYYDAPYAIKAAMEATGVTGDPAKLAEERVKIRDYVRTLKDFPGVYKKFTMDPGGWAHTDVAISQVQKGMAKIIRK